jgi:hypothetical protein
LAALVFDNPGAVTDQKMNGELVDAPAMVDAHTVALPGLRATFTFDRPEPDRLRLDGRLNGRPATMSLERVDLNGFTLRAEGSASATFKEAFVGFSRC